MKDEAVVASRSDGIPLSVVTRMCLPVSPARAWQGLMFFEEVTRRPPRLLRFALPTPLRAEGPRSQVGDETRCVYEEGHLVKRITRVDERRHYAFVVVHQELQIAGGIRLAGGSYTLTELPGETTRLEIETSYRGALHPRALWKPLEAAVCHAFHRHLLGAIRHEATDHGAALRRRRPSRRESASAHGHERSQLNP